MPSLTKSTSEPASARRLGRNPLDYQDSRNRDLGRWAPLLYCPVIECSRPVEDHPRCTECTISVGPHHFEQYLTSDGRCLTCAYTDPARDPALEYLPLLLRVG